MYNWFLGSDLPRHFGFLLSLVWVTPVGLPLALTSCWIPVLMALTLRALGSAQACRLIFLSVFRILYSARPPHLPCQAFSLLPLY